MKWQQHMFTELHGPHLSSISLLTAGLPFKGRWVVSFVAVDCDACINRRETNRDTSLFTKEKWVWYWQRTQAHFISTQSIEYTNLSMRFQCFVYITMRDLGEDMPENPNFVYVNQKEQAEAWRTRLSCCHHQSEQKEAALMGRCHQFWKSLEILEILWIVPLSGFCDCNRKTVKCLSYQSPARLSPAVYFWFCCVEVILSRSLRLGSRRVK